MNKYKRITINSYNKNAKELSKKFKDLMNLKQRDEFKKFINLIPGKKILDLGCGAGDHIKYFLEKGLDVIGVELSNEMIKLCKSKKLEVLKMDIEKLKFKKNSFHGIWAVTSLIHIPKSRIKKVIKKLNKILKDDGIIYVCMKEGNGEKFIDERFFSFWQKDELLKKFNKYFNLIDFKKVNLGKNTFLQFFFKKI